MFKPVLKYSTQFVWYIYILDNFRLCTPLRSPLKALFYESSSSVFSVGISLFLMEKN